MKPLIESFDAQFILYMQLCISYHNKAETMLLAGHGLPGWARLCGTPDSLLSMHGLAEDRPTCRVLQHTAGYAQQWVSECICRCRGATFNTDTSVISMMARISMTCTVIMLPLSWCTVYSTLSLGLWLQYSCNVSYCQIFQQILLSCVHVSSEITWK